MILGALTTKAAAGIGAAKAAMQYAVTRTNLFAMHMRLLLSGEEFINEAVTWASAAVCAFGAGFIIAGIIDLGEGNSQQNAAKKNEGISKLIGGIMVCLVGIVLVPKVRDIFPS